MLDEAAPPKGDLLVRRTLPTQLVTGAEARPAPARTMARMALSFSQRAKAS
jgi:hypothetical protein